MRTRQLYRNPTGWTDWLLIGLLLLVALFFIAGCGAIGPLGLPLEAGQTSVVPIDLSISFADLPGMAGILRQAVSGRPVEYQLDGTVGIEAGRFGQPTFGPMLLMRGELSVVR